MNAVLGHDAECEIASGAVGFDGVACLCASRAKASAAFNPDWRPRPSFRMWLCRPLRCLRLVVKGWNG